MQKKLKLALAAEEKKNKELDLENDKLEAIIKKLQGDKEMLKKQLKDANLKYEQAMAEMKAYKDYVEIERRVYKIEIIYSGLEQAVIGATQLQIEHNARAKVVSDMTPDKQPKLKAQLKVQGDKIL